MEKTQQQQQAAPPYPHPSYPMYGRPPQMMPPPISYGSTHLQYYQPSRRMPQPIGMGSGGSNIPPTSQSQQLPTPIGMGMNQISFGGHGAIMEHTSPVSPPITNNIETPQDSLTSPTQLPGFEYISAFVPISVHDVERFQLFNRDKSIRQSRNPIEFVFVAFVKGDPSKCKSWWKYALNSVVNVSGDFTHCEIVFKFKSGHYVACTIYMDEVVKMEIKPYKLIKWRTFGIYMSEDQAQNAYGYCLGQLGKNFNMTGIVWSFVPLIGPTIAKWYNGNERTFFCTELVLRALQEAIPHVFIKPQYDPQTTTPTMLKHILEQENMIVINTLENIQGLHLRLNEV